MMMVDYLSNNKIKTIAVIVCLVNLVIASEPFKRGDFKISGYTTYVSSSTNYPDIISKDFDDIKNVETIKIQSESTNLSIHYFILRRLSIGWTILYDKYETNDPEIFSPAQVGADDTRWIKSYRNKYNGVGIRYHLKLRKLYPNIEINILFYSGNLANFQNYTPSIRAAGYSVGGGVEVMLAKNLMAGFSYRRSHIEGLEKDEDDDSPYVKYMGNFQSGLSIIF